MAIHQWLDGFAYHIPLTWTVFAIAAFGAPLVAWITISFESVKAALNPPA